MKRGILRFPAKYQREDELPDFHDLNLVPNVIIDLERSAWEDDEETMEELFVFMEEKLQIERGGGVLCTILHLGMRCFR